MTRFTRREAVGGLLALSATALTARQATAAGRRAGRGVLIQGKGRVAVLDDRGAVTWEAPCPGVAHDIQMLPDGHVLTQTGAGNVVEFGRDGREVWRHEGRPKPGYDGRVEIHAFQRLRDGRTMIAESGNRRIVEVDGSGKILAEIPLTVENPDAHRDTRLVRKLKSGNYLACHEKDGKVREYDPSGKVVWTYALDLNNLPATGGHDGHGTSVYSAVRLKNGNTLIGGGNNNRVIEVDRGGKVAWSVERDELPGIRLFWVTTVQALPNGNVVVGNCHAGPDNPQLFEVTRDKKVVWTLKDFPAWGNDVASAQVLGVRGEVLR